ncbi:MAG: DUF998 domain-containing protein [Paracoccaceae bacterium]
MNRSARDTQTQLFGSCGVCAAAAFALADGLGIALTPVYSAWSDAISELVERGAAAKHILDPVLLLYHALVIPFAVGLRRAIYPGAVLPVGPIMLGFAGLAGVILTLFFPCDPGCEPFVSLRGTLHIFIAIPMGISILIAIWLVGAAMRASPPWHGFAFYSRATAIAGAGLAAVTIVLAETDHVGLFERLLTWSYLQWYVVIGLAIARGRMTGRGSSR